MSLLSLDPVSPAAASNAPGPPAAQLSEAPAGNGSSLVPADVPVRRRGAGALLAVGGAAALKLLQGAKVVKLLLFGAFIWSLALNHPLAFAVALAYAILVHESGHLLAMKRCGLPTSGIWFIPFLGAAAIAKQRFRSCGEEFFIAIAGPVFGLLSVVPLFAAALVVPTTRASAAAWFGYAATAAFVNLFNLLPIGILDGGRIVKSLSASVSRVLGLIVVGGGILLCGVLVAWVGGAVLGAILCLSIVELFRSRQQTALPMSRGAVVGGVAAYVALFAVFGLLAVTGATLARALGPV